MQSIAGFDDFDDRAGGRAIGRCNGCNRFHAGRVELCSLGLHSRDSLGSERCSHGVECKSDTAEDSL